MASTGALLFGFVVVHMLGNLQIFLGQDVFNDYAKHLQELPMLLWPARAVLLILLITHIAVAINLACENRAARPDRYKYYGTIQASYASRTMVFSGIIVSLFIVYHLLHFTFGKVQPQFFEMTDAKGREDIYAMVVHSFRNVYVSASYIAAMAVLCWHLRHGLQSMFQSVGWSSEKTAPCFEKFAVATSLLIFLGNCSIPAAILLGLVKLPGGGV